MKRLFLLFATFVVFVGLQAQVTYTDIDNFESGSTNVTVLWSGASSVVDNTTGTTGSKVLQVTDEAGSPFVNIPVTFESGKTWTDYDGIEMSIYPKTNTVESSSAKAIGVDLSLLKAYENAGVTYKDASGNTISDIIPWLGNNKGVNYVRIRLFVDPTNSYAQTLAGGSSYLNQLGGDLATVKVLGKRVKDAGMKFLLDIQYSDGWADPAKQVMPYSWTSTCNTQAKLQQKVYDYTKDVLTQLVAYGATPDMVQIGNEITYGMFFTNYDSPTSKYTNGSNSINYNTTSAGSAGVHCFVTYWSSSTYSGDTYWGNLCNVINKGSQAVREVCPNAKIMLHTERSAYTTKCTASGYTTYYMAQMFYKKMQDHSVDYDVIGLSYYPEDHGVLNNLNTILTSLEGSFPTKEIMLAEYGYSNNWARGSNTPGTIGYYKKGDQSSSCPLSQKEFISALITQLKNHSKVTGMFYWFAEENEATSSGPYGNGWRNSGLWANESTNVASNLTNSKYNQAAGCALPAVDVLADFQTAGAVTSKSAYYAQTWLKFYDADGAASWMHKKVGLNVDDEWGVDFATNGLGSWYTVKFGFNADSIADYISAVGSAPSSINLELRNYTNPSETNNDFYLDNVRFYKTVYESYALDFEDGTINSPSSAVSDAWCTGSQKVKANPSKSGINTSDKVMTVTNTWVEGCDLYTWSVPLPDNLSLYDSIYIDVYPTTGTSYLTLQFDAADDAAWTKLYDGATITNWTANAWNRLKIALSSLSDLTATHMYFGMWESGYSIDNITFHAIETAASEYTVTWNATTNGGTCATATTTVTAGNAIGTLPTATKTGATFNGWFTAATGGTQITAATVPTGDVTYYAQFTPNKYAITWKDGDNNTLKTDQVDYGTVPVYSGATPTKTATAQYTYTFNNTWSPTPVAVTAAATYTAQFSSTVNTYTISFNANGHGTAPSSQTVAYGSKVTNPGNLSETGWTFGGWYKEAACTNAWNFNSMTVTGAQTLYAKWTANTNTAYTVRHQWQNIDDNYYTLHESETKYGTTAQQTAATAKSYTGFTAKSFSQATIAADGSTVVDIYYDRQTFTITWKNGDNQTIETDQNVRYGATPTYDGATPTKTSTAQYTYTFNNTWSPAIATVTANATYTAQFDQTVNSYTITYLDDNNQEISHETLNYGVMPAPATPTKAATVQYTYTFNQWVPALATVTGDATYRATFNSTVNSYTITFYDEDGTTILKQSTLDYGMAITAPANPTKEGDAQYSYTFAGWTPALADGATVTGEASYKAVYTQSVNQYTITALATPAAGGSVAGAGTYDYSTSVTLTATAAEHYHFVQWSDGVSTATRTVTVTADATYTAEFAKDRFTITVSAVNGTVSGGGEYDYGTEIQLLATGNTGYTFSQWSDGITDNPRTVVVTANASYTAQFSTVAYSITKEVEGNGSIHGEDGGNINDVITLTAVADYGWEFVRWEDNSTNAVRQLTITGDMTVKAFFQRRTFTLTTKVNDTAMGSVTAGGSYLYEAEVSITATAQPNHHFVGWSDAAAEGATRTITILSDTTVTANFAIDQFTLTVTANDASMGTVTGAGTYNYGETAHLEATPTEGYHFVGWEPTSLGTESSVDVTVDGTVTTITAVFAINTYTVRFLVDGVEYDVQTVNHGSSAVAPTAPTKTGFTFTGWDKSLNNITANTDINAVFVPSGDTKYTVRHQWQNIADNFYTLHESELLYGTTDAPTSAIAKTYTGFTAQTVVQKTIAADGSTVVDIYYDRQTFEIEFVVDEEAIQTDNLRYGAMPVAPADPTKPADEQYTYTFDHWTPEIAVVTGNATYTALFSTTLNKYLVEFYNWNSVLLQSSEWEYGTTPVYSGPQPTREDDHQYTYTFAGWDPQIEPVTEEAFYFATFSSQLRTFSANDVVTSNDPDMGSVAISPQQNEYEYGEQITVTATPQQGYEFSGWQNEDDEIISTDATTTITVTDSTLTAIFEPSTNTRYLVHHLQQNLNDDLYTLVETDTLYGTTGRLTQVETVRRNYPGFYIKYCENVPIAADGSTELNALYDRLTYSVRWIVEDAERLDTLRYGAMPDYGSVPTKAATAQYTYTFAGWDPEVVTVTADATYRAVFSSEVNRYTVTFHANGHATDSEPASVEYGHIVNCTTLYADDGWIFDGWFREAGCQTPWDCLQDVVTADIDLYAKWIPSENMFYWVNYWQQNIYDDDYTLVEFEQIKGTTGQMTQAVAKDYTGFVMKPFSQVPIAPNTEVNIYYDRLRYEVNFVVEGVAVQTDSVRYYGSAEYRGETPTKPETDTHYYTFWCWDKATNMPIVADVTFTALFNEYSKGGGTGLEQVVITESGISGPEGMRIYDLTGRDVTNAMDHLYQGSYIIVLDGHTWKVMIP